MKVPTIHHYHHYTHPNAVGQPAQPRPPVETGVWYAKPAKAGWRDATIAPGQCVSTHFAYQTMVLTIGGTGTAICYRRSSP